MSSLTLQLPEDLASHSSDTTRFIASKLYEAGKLSLGHAARMTGLTSADFAEILGDYGVSYIQYTYQDILDDLKDYEIVIADASCFILLDKVDGLSFYAGSLKS